MWARIRNTWRALRGRAQWEQDLDEELRLHVQLRAGDLVRSGASPAEAERQARLEFGSREASKERVRAAFGLRWFDEVRQDLRYAGRVLRRSPGFTAVAVLSLAFGIGANTVVFSVLNAMVFRPLPVAAPDHLFFVQSDASYSTISYPNYRDFRDRNATLSGLIAYRFTEMGLGTGARPERLWGYLASGNYFDVLGVQPAMGRFFHQDDDQKPGASPYAVLSYACWQDRFQGDPQIIGKTIRLNSFPYTVVAVAPRRFSGTELFFVPEVWVPMMMASNFETSNFLEQRGNGMLWISGRLKPGVTRLQAQSNLNAVASALAREYPLIDDGLNLRLSRPGLLGDEIRGTVQSFVIGVLVLAGLVLMAACINLASLLSARSADRSHEIAIRTSIGASQARLVRQLMTEALLMALLGGACGCLLAVILLKLLSSWHIPVDFPIVLDVHPDARVFLFALAASTLTGLFFGTAPARHAWGLNPNHSLKGMTAAGGRRRWPLRDMLLALQLAVCCVVVTASFVAARGLSRALQTPAGMEMRNAKTLSFDLALAHYAPRQGGQFRRRVLDAILGQPGVTAAGFIQSIPLTVDQSSTGAFPEDATDFRPNRAVRVTYYVASPGYLAAAGTRLKAGRDFTWQDVIGKPPVAIVNEAFARKVVGTEDAVGHRFRQGPASPTVEIIGVVETGKYVSLAENPRPALFWPSGQVYQSGTSLVVRTAGDDPLVVERVRRIIAGLDPTLPVYGSGSLSQAIGVAFLPAQAATVALTAFGALALMLALTGVFGLASYAVSRRVREIGIRMALGADPGQVLRSVLGRLAGLLTLGLAVGLAGGAAASRLLADVVYQATPRDPVVWVAMILAIAVTAFVAALGPARRALSLDPLRALRQE